MIQVLIIDDHAIVREGWKQVLAGEQGIEVTGEAASGEKALELLDSEEFDAVVLDIALPGISGIEVLNELKKRGNRVPVLILSMHAEEQYALRAFELGARGYLTKGTGPKELVEAIHTIVKGSIFAGADLLVKLREGGRAGQNSSLHDLLSPREFQVMLRLARGEEVKEMSVALGLSEKTVHNHRAHLLDKMGLRSNAEVALYALRQGLIE